MVPYLYKLLNGNYGCNKKGTPTVPLFPSLPKRNIRLTIRFGYYTLLRRCEWMVELNRKEPRSYSHLKLLDGVHITHDACKKKAHTIDKKGNHKKNLKNLFVKVNILKKH